jgi:hypothetical protein
MNSQYDNQKFHHIPPLWPPPDLLRGRRPSTHKPRLLKNSHNFYYSILT